MNGMNSSTPAAVRTQYIHMHVYSVFGVYAHQFYYINTVGSSGRYT